MQRLQPDQRDLRASNLRPYDPGRSRPCAKGARYCDLQHVAEVLQSQDLTAAQVAWHAPQDPTVWACRRATRRGGQGRQASICRSISQRGSSAAPHDRGAAPRVRRLVELGWWAFARHFATFWGPHRPRSTKSTQRPATVIACTAGAQIGGCDRIARRARRSARAPAGNRVARVHRTRTARARIARLCVRASPLRPTPAHRRTRRSLGGRRCACDRHARLRARRGGDGGIALPERTPAGSRRRLPVL
jgi:hypothetical protein